VIEPFLLEQAKAGGTGPHQALRLGQDPSPADVEWRGSAAADVEVEADARHGCADLEETEEFRLRLVERHALAGMIPELVADHAQDAT